MWVLKGQCHEIFWLWLFFIKHLFLVPLDTPRKDFDFFRIFEELFEFVIDSPVYSLPGNRDSPVYSSPGSHDSLAYSSPGCWDSPVVNTPGSRPKLVNKRSFESKILQGVETPLWLIHWGVLTPWSIIHQKVVLLTYSYAFSKYNKKPIPRWIHHRGVETPLCIHHRGVETRRCIHYRGVIFDTGESYYWC